MDEISKDKVSVIVENYDIENFVSKPFNVVIESLSHDKVNKIIKEMPVKTDKAKLKIRVITDEFIFSKHRFFKKTVFYRPNRKGNFFLRWRYEVQSYAWSGRKSEDTFDIAEMKMEQIIPDWLTTISNILVLILLTPMLAILPLLNIFNLIWNFEIILGLGLQGWVICGVLLVVSCIVVIKIFWEGIKSFKKNKLKVVDRKTYTPYYSGLTTIDFDYPLLVFGQFFYFIIFELYSFDLSLFNEIFLTINLQPVDFIWNFLTTLPNIYLVLYAVLLTYLLWGTLITYYRSYRTKNAMLEHLPTELRLEDKIDSIYYLHLHNLIKTKKVGEVGLLTKLTTLISAAFTLLPLIQDLIIS